MTVGGGGNTGCLVYSIPLNQPVAAACRIRLERSKMEPETPAPWWSWAPRFPKIAIAIAALLYDAVAAGTILWRLNNQETLAFWPRPGELLAAVITDSITSNAVALAMFLQLNAELISMILTLKANYEEKKEAVARAEARGKAAGEAAAEAAAAEAEARGIAQGKAAGEAAAEAAAAARIREWYEAHRHDLTNAPPPPYIDGHQNGAGGRPDTPAQG